MTLVACWIRRFPSTQELLIAADSRLTGGSRWDACPKIFQLGITRSVMCFAGRTRFAYPVLQQLQVSVNAYSKARSGVLDIGELRSHIVAVLNGVIEQMGDFAKGLRLEDEVATVFVLAGYSWRHASFRMFEITYAKEHNRFAYINHSTKRRGPILFAGDYIAEARDLLKIKRRTATLNMEPFEVVRDMSLSPKYYEIGGPTQFIRMGMHGSVMPVCVYWPARHGGRLTLMGRPLLPYERYPFMRLDARTLQEIRGYTYTE